MTETVPEPVPEVGEVWRRTPDVDQPPMATYDYTVRVTGVFGDGDLVEFEFHDSDDFLERQCEVAAETEQAGGDVEKTGLCKFVTKNDDGEWVPKDGRTDFDFTDRFDRVD